MSTRFFLLRSPIFSGQSMCAVTRVPRLGGHDIPPVVRDPAHLGTLANAKLATPIAGKRGDSSWRLQPTAMISEGDVE